jgi:hypothetical protein
MRSFKEDIQTIIKFAIEFNIPYWETPYEERTSKSGLYFLYYFSDGDCLTVNLYKYKPDEDFDRDDLIKSIDVNSWESIKMYERLDDNFGDIINNIKNPLEK